jgi:hypothetical protein
MSRTHILIAVLSLSLGVLLFPQPEVIKHSAAAQGLYNRQPSGEESAPLLPDVKREVVVHREPTAAAKNAAAPSLSFANVPTVLPRNTPLANYSPLIAIHYDGLAAETHTLKLFLLETGNFFCASNQYCEALFTINNQSGATSSGDLLIVRNMDVFNYQNFIWVADLYNQAGNHVISTTQAASSTLNRPPVLNPIGNRTATTGQSLHFVVTASDPDGDAVSLSAQNLPPGATFDGATGQFHWQSPTLGTFTGVRFFAAQASPVSLSDAEFIDIQVSNTPPAGVLSFGASAYTTGEAGPAVLTVTRPNGTGGTVTVNYSTVNGTAAAGADFVGAQSTPLTFADGQTTKTIRIPINNDINTEASETFQVQLSAPTGGATLGMPSVVTVTIVDDDDPGSAGQWGSVVIWPTVPIHTSLLPSGKVIFWDRHHAAFGWDGDPRLWDPASPNLFTSLPLPGWDLFCSGHSFMADGRLFVTGGHIADGVGDVKAGIYDPSANTWTRVPDMNGGRWYPTNTTMPKGDILVLGGTRNGYTDVNPLPQVWQARSGTWRNLTNALLGTYPAWPDFYPFAFLAPNGRVFVAGPQQTARYLDTSGAGAWTVVANSSMSYRDYGTAVMYADGKIIILGGNLREPDPNATPTILPAASAEVINLNDPTPAWQPTASMSVGRRHANSTLLPDGKVLVTGGSSAPGFDEPAGAVLYAELWDPATGTWTPLAAYARYQGYHSNALLLPDARVLVVEGGHPDPPGRSSQTTAEIYSPPYLFKGPRPVIDAAPTVVTYGQTFSIQTPDAASVTNVNWIRLPSVTHAFNQNQRINRLNFSQTAGGLNVTAPASANLCPPGHYMLFVLNGNGVPSVAKIIQVADTVLQFSNATYSVSEAGTSATINVTRVGDSTGTVSVNYATSDGTATAVSDYTATAGTLTFADGVTSQSFSVPVVNDALDEPDETVNLTLSAPQGGASLGVRATSALTVDDDDQPPSLSINDVRVTEGDGGMTNAIFAVSLSAASGQLVMVSYATADGTAVTPADYQPAASTLTFSPGETSRILTVQVRGDVLDEADETFLVNLSNPSNASIADGLGIGTVADDDPLPSLSINDVAVTEGDGGTVSAVFTVGLSAASGKAVTASYATANGTALAGSDYQQASGTLTFAAGDLTKNVAVHINGDTSKEVNETFLVGLTDPGNATIADGQGIGTINDDDAPLIQFDKDAYAAAEAVGSVAVTVKRLGDASGAASVNYATSDGSASERSDYTTALGTLRFAAGETSKTVTLFITNDVFVEPSEGFNVTLSNPQGAALGSPPAASVTIDSNDTTPPTSNNHPADQTQFFVRQHYVDFLNREPDAPGLQFWINEVEGCGSNAQCREVKRINVSAAFFLSIEFQETGFYAIRVHRVAFGRRSEIASTRVTYRELIRDQRQIGEGVIVGQAGYEGVLDANKQTYAAQTAGGAAFASRFPQTTAADYVDALYTSAGVTPTTSERQDAVNAYNAAGGGAAGRTASLRRVADSTSVRDAELNTAFVLLQYYGYLRRNPTDPPDASDVGYQFWLAKLNQFGGNYIAAEMVKAFITSIEYRQRFGQ